MTYFHYAACKSLLQRLDKWIRRKLRCVRLKQCKRSKAIAVFLINLGVPELNARRLGAPRRGWWWKAGSPPAYHAMDFAWFRTQGLVSLSKRYVALQA